MKLTSCVGLFSAASAFGEVKATVLVGAHDAEDKFALVQNLHRNNLFCWRTFWPSSIKNCRQCSCVGCTICDVCKEGYFVGQSNQEDNSGKCVECPENCATCSSEQHCEICKDGYFVWNNVGQCVECRGTNCASCSSNGDCEICKDGYKVAANRRCEANSIPAMIFENGGECIKGDFKTLKKMGSEAHTIRATVKMPDDMPTVNARQWILNLGQTGDGANHWLWSPTNVHNAGNLQFGCWNGGQIKGVSEGMTNDQMIKAASLTTTFDGENYSFYIDGELKKTIVITPPLNITTNDLRVGLQPAVWKESQKEVDFTGCVTKVEVWDSALTSVEVAKEE